MGLDLFFPRELISSTKVWTQSAVPSRPASVTQRLFQPKQLRRLVRQTFQGYATLTQDQCMARFFSTLAQCYSYTQESFACRLVVRVTFTRGRESEWGRQTLPWGPQTCSCLMLCHLCS